MRIKALGSSTRVLSEWGVVVTWGGGQQQCSSTTKEGHSLGGCQPTPPFVYGLIKRKPLPQKVGEFFHKEFNEANSQRGEGTVGGGQKLCGAKVSRTPAGFAAPCIFKCILGRGRRKRTRPGWTPPSP